MLDCQAMKRFLIVLVGCVLCSLGTHAAATEEDPFLADLPIVLTPSRLHQPQNEAPAAVTVIDRALIKATGYRDIPRLLRLVPGMQVGQERGSRNWVTYHGMGNDYPSWMQVLIDGRSVYSPGNMDGVDWSALPITIEEIERIEVVRGTNSAAYGANAFLGVINIITRDSTDSPGKKLAVRAGTRGIRDLGLELGGSMGAGSLRLNAETKGDQGFAGLHDAMRYNVFSLRGDQRLSNNDEIMFRLAASDGSRGLGYPDSIFGNNAERRADSTNAALHLQWRHTPGPNEEWLLHYYRNQDRTDEAWFATAPPPFNYQVPLDRNRSSVRNNIELQHRLALSDSLRAVWGLEARHDQMDSTFLYYGAPHQHSSMTRAFGLLEWRFKPDWSLNANALIEKFDSDAPKLSPRLFANWQLSPADTLRFGYARAWRQPTMFERNGDVRATYQGALLVHPYMPNPDLRASRMDSLELGYLSQFQTWRTRLDVRLFMERIADYITRVSHPEDTAPLLSGSLPSARYENLNTAVVLRGLEYQVDSTPRAGTRLLFSHTMIDRGSSDRSVSQLTAPYTASLSWIQDWGGNWSSTLTALHMGPLAGGSGFVPTSTYVSKTYTTIDARLARSMNVGASAVTMALTATNLGGRHQEITDRAEQFLHGNTPVNQTSPMIWLTLSINPK
ncbi:MAG: TonB-dependent receptor [Rhodocyclaceae bacterium]|nr:TonB-dependent receptor [Rhodocyclaceae bacterium]